MGYGMQLMSEIFHIKREHVKPAMEAWKLATSDDCDTWEFVIDNDCGDIIGVNFTGDRLWDEDDWFQAIAPFVTSGSYIQLQGEDGYNWRYLFENGECTILDGNIVFSEHPCGKTREQKICEILKLHVNEMYEMKKLMEGGFWAEMEFGIEWFQCETPFDAKVLSDEPLTFDDGFRVGYEAFTILVRDLLTATEEELDDELQMLEEDVKK